MMCLHPRTRLVRVICRDGRTHIMEECLDCGGNARGSAIWVPRSSVPVDPESLPIAKDLRTPEDRGEQPLLF
jgi:hypothetical protein